MALSVGCVYRRGIEEDVEVIRVQREVREKSDRLLVLDSQYSALERVRVREIDRENTLYCCVVSRTWRQ